MSSEGNYNGDEPTHNPPWPYVDPFTQGRFERKCIADGETLNFDNLPKLQSWSWWAGGLDDSVRVMTVLMRIDSHSNTVQRPLNRDEVNAIAEHAAHSVRAYSWIRPLSTAIALGITFAKRRTFSFPFYKPKMVKFDPHSFPTRNYALFNGPRAAFLWHSMRFMAYVPFTWLASLLFCKSISDQSFVAHSRRDPRLAELLQEGHQKLQQQGQHLRRRPGHLASTPQDLQQTGGPSQDNENAGFSNQPTPERFGRAPDVSRAPQPNWTHTSPPTSDEIDALFDDDDASPVAPSARRPEAGRRQTGSSGSSWEWIRQQAKSGTDWERGDSSGQERGWGQLRQDKTQNPRDSTPKTDSYSYSDADEEREKRNYEKEQAQKEFDALLEAERRGEGDNSRSRGWRR